MTDISVVIAAFNERTNLEAVMAELEPVLSNLGRTFEILVVDDGSTDGTDLLLADLARTRPHLAILRFPENRGKSTAWTAAFKAAKGNVICTMDADGQNDPADIPRLIDRLEAGLDCVSGWRKKRATTFWSRALPSRMVNGMIRWMAGTRLHDQGCGLKVFRREAVLGLELSRGMHRFVGMLVERKGGTTDEVPVVDRPRRHGASKYGIERLVQVPVDLVRLMFLTDVAILGTLTLIGLLLRLFHLGHESFWSDEILSMHYASKPIGDIPSSLQTYSVHPPLYFMLLSAWTSLVGVSEAWVRLPSAILGTLSIPLLSHLGTRLVDRRTGILAALLLALSPFHIFYSQEARPYAFLGFTILVSLVAYHRLLRKSDRWGLFWYAASAVVLMYTHVFGLVTIACQVIHFVFFRPPAASSPGRLSVRGWIGLQFLLGLAFLPWLPSLLSQSGHSERYAWLPGPSWKGLAETYLDYAGHHAALAVGLGLLFVAAVAAHRHRLATVLFWLAGPLVISFLVSILIRPVHHSRYTIQTFLMLNLAAAAGMALLSRHRVGRVISVVALCIVAVLPLPGFYHSPEREQWRQATAYVDGHALPLDRVFVPGPSLGYKLAYDFYSTRRVPRFDPDDPGPGHPPVIDPRSRVWVVQARSNTPMVELRSRYFPGYRIAWIEPDRFRKLTLALLEK